MGELTDRGKKFHAAIEAFIQKRREDKLKGKEDDEAAVARYDYETWLASAAQRVDQIQAVTHVLKATHPDARGSSLRIAPQDLPQHVEIGSHVLGDDFAEDVVGNAAALDVFKFLKLEVDGRRLLDWVRAGDADLRSALHADEAVASAWMAAFAGLVRNDAAPASHEVAKQVYWLVGSDPSDNDQFHLLEPLFSSSLAHAVHADIQESRFGEANKAARQAFFKKEAHEANYRDYRGLVTRKLGGTKPQNISQLNSERGGVNYLLSSLPPHWKSFKLRPFKTSDDLWAQFLYFGAVRHLLRELSAFLLSSPPPTMETRFTREGIEQALGAQLPVFADTVQDALGPGWSRDAADELDPSERLWLDARRLELGVRTDTDAHRSDDEAFEATYQWGDWPDEVAGRFANWVNAQLRSAGLAAAGEVEYRHWARQALVDAAWPIPLRRPASTKEALA